MSAVREIIEAAFTEYDRHGTHSEGLLAVIELVARMIREAGEPAAASNVLVCGGRMLTVADLLAFLSTQPSDLPLISARDEEGNGFSPLEELSHGMYVAESSWSGRTYPTPEEIDARDDMSHEDDGAPEGAVRVLVLWPRN